MYKIQKTSRECEIIDILCVVNVYRRVINALLIVTIKICLIFYDRISCNDVIYFPYQVLHGQKGELGEIYFCHQENMSVK